MAFNYGMNLATDALAGAAEKYYAGKLANQQAIPQLMQTKQQLDTGAQSLAQQKEIFPLQRQKAQIELQKAQQGLTQPQMKVLPDGRIVRIAPQGQVSFEGERKKSPEELKQEAEQRYALALVNRLKTPTPITDEEREQLMATAGLPTTEFVRGRQQDRNALAVTDRQLEVEKVRAARAEKDRQLELDLQKMKEQGNIDKALAIQKQITDRANSREDQKENQKTQSIIRGLEQAARAELTGAGGIFRSPAGVNIPGATEQVKKQVLDYLVHQHVIQQAAQLGVVLPENYGSDKEPTDPDYVKRMTTQQPQASGGGLWDWLFKGTQAPTMPSGQQPPKPSPPATPPSTQPRTVFDKFNNSPRPAEKPPLSKLDNGLAIIKMREAQGIKLPLILKGQIIKESYPEITPEEMKKALLQFTEK